MKAWLDWDDSRPDGWDLNHETGILERAQIEFGFSRDKPVSVTYSNPLQYWRCGACNFNNCDVCSVICPTCKAAVTVWSCVDCSNRYNPTWKRNCEVCGQSQTASLEKAAVIKAVKEHKTLLVQLEERQEPFCHPGTYYGCGGNPTGFTKCGQSGACTGACVRCGKDTHWSCCGHMDATSQYCLAGISLLQAQKNAAVCAVASRELKRCMDLPGAVFPGPHDIVDWICDSCNCINVITNKLCQVCDTVVPKAVAQSLCKMTRLVASNEAPGNDKKRKIKSILTPVNLYAIGRSVTLSKSYSTLSDAADGFLQPTKVGIICSVPEPDNCLHTYNIYTGSGGPTTHYLVCPESEFITYCASLKKNRSSQWVKNLKLKLWYYERDALTLLSSITGAGMGGDRAPVRPHEIRVCELPAGLRGLGHAIEASAGFTESGTRADCCTVGDDDRDFAPWESFASAVAGADTEEALDLVAAHYCERLALFGVEEDDVPVAVVSTTFSSVAESAEMDYNGEVNRRVHERLHTADSNNAEIDLEPHPTRKMIRAESIEYHSMCEYEPIDSVTDLVAFKDLSGNGAAHHCAFIGLFRSYTALIFAGASRYEVNLKNICPAAILSGVATLSSSSSEAGVSVPLSQMHPHGALLFKKLFMYDLVPDIVKHALLRCPFEYCWPSKVADIEEALQSMDGVRFPPINNGADVLISAFVELVDGTLRRGSGT
jgi:hypothetical protein